MKTIRGIDYPTFEDTWNDSKFFTKEEKQLMEFEADIIESLIKAREAKGMTQSELAQLSGMKQPALARIETQKSSPQIDTLFKILRPLGLTI
ncbi:MAG: helix-turn-helix domain-containing protein [Elusimicrobiota bacterium]|jgi:DNA-binding XRE family transcriptional regulator|nr:helix-turn-helix domain-containing protein [Elusimicrobiota bacterium]